MNAIRKLALCLWLPFCCQCAAQIYETNNVIVRTFAGSGFYGYVDGQGTQTMFYAPSHIVADAASNLFVLDNANYRIRKITPDATVSTFVGGGQVNLPAYGTNASLGSFSFGPMAIDHSNVLWIATGYSPSLLRVSPDGLVSQISLAGISSVSGIGVDSRNNLFLSDGPGNKIYRYRTNGALEVFVGSGNPGAVDGNGIFNSFNFPTALTVDAADNIYVSDSGNDLIRRVNQNRDVVTIAGTRNFQVNLDGAGTNAGFSAIGAMCADNSGNIIFTVGPSYGGGSAVRKMSPSTNVTTIAGNFSANGYANGAGNQALFSGPIGVCIAQGTIFVVDSGNERIRSLTFDPLAQAVSPALLSLNTYAGLTITGSVGRAYRIESSTNSSNWNPEVTILLPSSPYLWIDPEALGQKKFYRAFLLP
jgi:sugar lactone lactonase YvrE